MKLDEIIHKKYVKRMTSIKSYINPASIKSYIKMQLNVSQLKNRYFRYILEINTWYIRT